MSFERYPHYKASSSEWLEEVPAHWRVGAIKYFVLAKNGSIRTGPFGSHLTSSEMLSGPIRVYNQRSVIDGDFDSGEAFISEEKFSELASFEVFPGDLLVTTRGTIGRAAILPEQAERGILHPCLLRLQPDNAHIDTKFLKTLIQDSDLVKTQLSYWSNATTIDVIYSDTIASVIIPVPPVAEQIQIITFLNQETAKIDRLVGEQQRLMELLKEKRQAVISHALAKGLNPHAPMRPSGVEWLGDMPAHWEMLPLKRDLDFLTSGSRGWAENYSAEGELFIRIANLTRGSIGLDLSDIQRVSVPHGAEGSRTKVRTGDVLFSITAYLGSVAVVPDALENAYVSQHVALARLAQSRLEPKWVGFVALSIVGQTWFELQSYGGTKIQLSLDDVRNLPIPIPPRAEQHSIIAYIEDELAKFDTLTAEAQRAIDLLQERRTALISAAVIGQIDVRGLAESEAA
jgi:type I restriction enzyme, S subunit